jgi:type IV pilus assembly protein PilP
MKRIPLFIIFGLSLGCLGEEEGNTVPRGVRPAGGSVSTRAKESESQQIEGLPPITPPKLTEDDFAESETNRDPFRSFLAMFSSRVGITRRGPRRIVKIESYTLDELRLVAIVRSEGMPYAMVVDPEGTGHIIRRGDFVGKGEIVSRKEHQGSMQYEINWRVARIRDTDVVLIREDPLSPGGVPITRILPLFPKEE